MGFDSRVYERPINTIQAMMDNSKVGNYITIYEDGDCQVYVNDNMPKKYLYKPTQEGQRGAVKCPNGLMLYDEEEKTVIANTPQEVFNFLDGCDILEVDLNCTQEQKDQVMTWFKEKWNVEGYKR